MQTINRKAAYRSCWSVETLVQALRHQVLEKKVVDRIIVEMLLNQIREKFSVSDDLVWTELSRSVSSWSKSTKSKCIYLVSMDTMIKYFTGGVTRTCVVYLNTKGYPWKKPSVPTSCPTPSFTASILQRNRLDLIDWSLEVNMQYLGSQICSKK